MAVPDEVLSRVGEAKNLDGLSDDDLKAVLKEYYDRCVQWGQKLSKKSQNFVLLHVPHEGSESIDCRSDRLSDILKILIEDL